MDGAGGRSERGRRETRSAAWRGRGAARGAAGSTARGRGTGGSPEGTATAGAPRRDGSTARRGRPARRASAARSLPAGGGRAPAAPQDSDGAPADGAAAARRQAAVPDGVVFAPAAARQPPSAAGALRLREVLSGLSLVRQDVSEASGLVNRVVLHLIQAIRSQDSCFSSITRLSAGSYYEHVKVGTGAPAAPLPPGFGGRAGCLASGLVAHRSRVTAAVSATGGAALGPGEPRASRHSCRARRAVSWPFRREEAAGLRLLLTNDNSS